MENKERFCWIFALIAAIALSRAWAYTQASVNYVPPANADALGAVHVEIDPCPSTTLVDGGGAVCNAPDFKIWGTMCGISSGGDKLCKDLFTHAPLTNNCLRTVRSTVYNLGSAVFPGAP